MSETTALVRPLRSSINGASAATREAVAEINETRERRNWLIHQLYVRQEYIDCLSVIEAQLRDTEGTCEYALYVKGLLKRTEGALTESLELLQAAVLVSPESVESRKQLGRAFYLLGRHTEALAVFCEAEVLGIVRGLQEDWELHYNIGMCHSFLRNVDEAVNSFLRSLGIQRHDITFLQLGKQLIEVKNYIGAISVFTEALESSPHSPELLATLGQLHLLDGNTTKAFEFYCQCLTEDATNVKAIMGASSIIQNNGEFDVALTKYRVAVAKIPDSAQLQNNIGVCYFGKKNLYAAVSCLRKSVSLAPFEWIANYNLGITYLSMGRHASAFQHLSASITLKPQFAPSYMYLGVCLSSLNDIENAFEAYEKSLSINDDVLARINYTVTLLNSNRQQQAALQLNHVLPLWDAMSDMQRQELSPNIMALMTFLLARLSNAPTASPKAVSVSSAPLRGEDAAATIPHALPPRGISSSMLDAMPSISVSAAGDDSPSVAGSVQRSEDIDGSDSAMNLSKSEE